MAAVDSIKVSMIGARTDSSGTAEDDWDQEEVRLLATVLLRPGVIFCSAVDGTPNRNAWRVRQDTGSNMKVQVGSGTSGADVCCLLSSTAHQGLYVLRLDATAVTLTVPASDDTNPTKYGVYAYINDEAYSGTTDVHYAGLEVLAGTPAASPTVPAPDNDWSASLLLWSFQLAANATAVTNTILDNANAADGRTSSSVMGASPLDVALFL